MIRDEQKLTFNRKELYEQVWKTDLPPINVQPLNGGFQAAALMKLSGRPVAWTLPGSC